MSATTDLTEPETSPAGPAAAADTARRRIDLGRFRELSLVPAILVLMLIGFIVSPAFLTSDNLIGVLQQSTELSLLVLARIRAQRVEQLLIAALLRAVLLVGAGAGDRFDPANAVRFGVRERDGVLEVRPDRQDRRARRAAPPKTRRPRACARSSRRSSPRWPPPSAAATTGRSIASTHASTSTSTAPDTSRTGRRTSPTSWPAK